MSSIKHQLYQYEENEEMIFLGNEGKIDLRISTVDGKLKISNKKIYEIIPKKSWKETICTNLFVKIICLFIFLGMTSITTYFLFITFPEFKGEVFVPETKYYDR